MSKSAVGNNQVPRILDQGPVIGHFSLDEEEDEDGNMIGVRLICPRLRNGSQLDPLHVWLPYDHEQGNLFFKDQAKQCINEHLHQVNYTHHGLRKLLSTVRRQKGEENEMNTEFSFVCNIVYGTIEESLVLKLPEDAILSEAILSEAQSELIAQSLNKHLLAALQELWKYGIINPENEWDKSRGPRPLGFLKAIRAWRESWEAGRGELQRLAKLPVHGDVTEHATVKDFAHLLGLAEKLPDLQTKYGPIILQRNLQALVGSQGHQIPFSQVPVITSQFREGRAMVRQVAAMFPKNMNIDGLVAADTVECDTGSLSSSTNARTERTDGRCTQLTEVDGSAGTGTSQLDKHSTNQTGASLSEIRAGMSSGPWLGGLNDSYRTVRSEGEPRSPVPVDDGSIRREVPSLLGKTKSAFDMMVTLHSTAEAPRKRRRSGSNDTRSIGRSKASC